LFRRTKPEQSTPAVPTKEGGKGRPTPTRREAEAAARARAKAPRGRKEAAKQTRAQRAAQSQRMREGLKTGDERYLPARDRGPIKRFIRDRVDSRLCLAELLLPLLLVIMLMTYSGQPQLQSFANGLWAATIFMIFADSVLLTFKIRREVRQRFPDESHKGAVLYAILRSMQLRFLRLPKPKVKLGQKLPDRY
jgi:hypothetical protein